MYSIYIHSLDNIWYTFRKVFSVCMEGMPDRASTLSTYSIKGHVLNIQNDPSITEKINMTKHINLHFNNHRFQFESRTLTPLSNLWHRNRLPRWGRFGFSSAEMQSYIGLYIDGNKKENLICWTMRHSKKFDAVPLK